METIACAKIVFSILIRRINRVEGPRGPRARNKFGGTFTTESNAEFDRWLKAQDPASGVREFEAVARVAETAGLELGDNRAMPSSNQLLCFFRRAGT